MLKKMGVVLNAYIRQRLATDGALRFHPGLRAAIKLPAQIAGFCLCRQLGEDWRDFPEGMEEYFDGSHDESDWMAGAFANAARMEGLIMPFIADSIQIEVHFHKGGKKQPESSWLRVTFDTGGGRRFQLGACHRLELS